MWAQQVTSGAGSVLDSAHLLAEIALAIILAFIVTPLAKVADRLRAIETRLAYIEGKITAAGEPWRGEDRRLARPGSD